MHNITDVLATISKAPEKIRQQATVFSEPLSINERDKVAKSVTALEAILTDLDPVLKNILLLSDSKPNLGLLWLATNAAYAELKRTLLLLKMARLNLTPIPLLMGLNGFFESAIKSTMAPAEERAMNSAMLTLTADLKALENHLQGVARQLKIEVDSSGDRGTFQSL